MRSSRGGGDEEFKFVWNKLGLVSDKEIGLASKEEVGSVSDDVVLVLVSDDEVDENSIYPIKHLAPFRELRCYLGDFVDIYAVHPHSMS